MSKLRDKRKASGLTVSALAESASVNPRMIQKYENGEKDISKAAVSTVLALAKVLGCTVEDLI
jgi:transcriptional regulator with XRE-family HTH domain